MKQRNAPTLAIPFKADAARRALIAEALAGAGTVVYLQDLAESDRRAALRNATAVFAQNMTDLPDDAGDLLGENCRLLQFHSAGVDYLPLRQLPDDLPIAGNGGAFAEPMAEHAVAMALAAAKRLFIEHEKLKTGEFNQFVRNKMLAGTPDRLDELLAASDVLVLSLPLTQTTERLLTADKLALMKPDAILVNLARGEIIDEAALYAHLLANPAFTACIDAWWVEPVRHGRFAMGHPFLDLPNVIGSPHNSAAGGSGRGVAVRRAVENCARAMRGETPWHLVGPEERML